MTLYGLDMEARLTRWKADYAFGIARCVREGGAVDVDYAPNVRIIEDAGAIAGGYHFVGHGRPIRDDARRFVDAMGDPVGRLVCPDFEDAGLTWDEHETWWDEYRAHHPAQPVLEYTYYNYWRSRGWPENGGAVHTPYLWAANPRTDTYLGDTAWPWRQLFGGWRDATVLQWHGTTTVGVGCGVDINAFRGMRADLYALTQPLPDSSTGDLMQVTRVKGEDWKAAADIYLFTAPDPASAHVATIPAGTILRTIAEAKGEDGGSWRLTEYAGAAAWFRYRNPEGVIGNMKPLVAGGDPAVDALLAAYVGREPLYTDPQLDAAIADAVLDATGPLDQQVATLTGQVTTLTTKVSTKNTALRAISSEAAQAADA